MKPKRHAPNSTSVVLGWETTPSGDPRYWLNTNARAGKQDDLDLVTVPPDCMDSHTAIIAQSGSGKSFFLGRLVEELVLKTRSKCLILDPNGDFQKIHQCKGSQLWRDARYDISNRTGQLPHEASRREFASEWLRRTVGIYKRSGNIDKPKLPYADLRLWWPALSAELVAEDLEDPLLRAELYHLHAFVKALEELVVLRAAASNRAVKLLEVAEDLQRMFRKKKEEAKTRASLIGAIPRLVDEEFQTTALLNVTPNQFAKYFGLLSAAVYEIALGMKTPVEGRIRFLKQQLVFAFSGLEYVSERASRLYFGKAREYSSSSLLADKPRLGLNLEERIKVVELWSLLERRLQPMVVSAILAELWRHVRSEWEGAIRHDAKMDLRVPRFVVVDEAHNLVPAKVESIAQAAVRDQFRAIVAEGRKYGLFLILVSQRPDKLDPVVASECENKVVMKLSGPSVLAMTRDLLAMDDVPKRVMDRCLEFGKGLALIAGRWSPNTPRILYCAARRTIEGGRNLQPQHWARP